MVKFKLLVKKFRILVLLVSALLFIILVPNIAAQNNYNVVFDETRPYGSESLISDTAGYGGSNFAYALQSRGFNVSKISDKPISYNKLQGHDVLIIMSSYEDYSQNEIYTIEEFVKNGGGLLLAVQSWQGVIDFGSNRLAKRFGVSFANNVVISDSTNYYRAIDIGISNKKNIINIYDIQPHAITRNVSSFYLPKGTSIMDKGPSHVLANTSSEAWHDITFNPNPEKDINTITGIFPVLSEMTYGKGRIVFIGSNKVFINDWLYLHPDNGQLGLNVISWLVNLSDTPTFIPPLARSIHPSDHRIAGIIVATLLLFIGLIYKIRKDEGRKKPTTIKPIEKWKVTALIIGHTIVGLWSLFLVFVGYSNINLFRIR